MIKKLQMASVLLLSSFLQASDNNQPASPQTHVAAAAPAIKRARAASIAIARPACAIHGQRNLFPDMDSASTLTTSAGSTSSLINGFDAMSIERQR